MSTFNDELTIEKAVRSILNQSYQNLELLVLDDCSTDNTLSILKKLNEADNRVKIFQNKVNIGLTKSLNFLINKSNSELIARQDADDTSKKNRLLLQYNFLQENKLDACTSVAINMQTGKEIHRKTKMVPLKILINYKNPFIHGTLLIKKKVLLSIGMYDENFYYSQDYKLFHDLIKKNFNIRILNKKLYNLNTLNNISSNHSSIQKYYSDCVKKKIKPQIKNENIY